MKPLLYLSLGLGLASGATAADWPQFRGPLSNGFSAETGVPAQIDGAEALAWSAALPGRGVSSPIVVGDRVFVTAASGPRQEHLRVLCFNAHDGTLRWERQFWATGRTMCHEKTSVAGPTPASDGTRVFALFSSNDLVGLDLDGNLLWLRGLTRDYPNVSNSLGMQSSLIVAEGVLVAQVENDTESYTLGLEVRDGTNRWRLDRPKLANWTSPVFVAGEGGRRLVALQSGKGLAAVDPASGKVVWNYADGASTIPSGAPAGAVVFVPSFGLTAIQADAGQAVPRQLWRAAQLRPGTSSPAVLNDRVYVLNDAGVLNCGDAATGKRLWQLRLKGPFSASPVIAGTHLFAVNEKGLLQVADLTAAEGAVVSERDLAQTVLATPAIARGAVYVRSDQTLWKLGKR